MDRKRELIRKIILSSVLAGFLSGASALILGGGFLPGLFFGGLIALFAGERAKKLGISQIKIAGYAAAGYLAMNMVLLTYGMFFFMDEGDDIIFEKGFLKILFFASWIVSTIFLKDLKKNFLIVKTWKVVFLGGLGCALLSVCLILLLASTLPFLAPQFSLSIAIMIWQIIIGSWLAYKANLPL